MQVTTIEHPQATRYVLRHVALGKRALHSMWTLWMLSSKSSVWCVQVLLPTSYKCVVSFQILNNISQGILSHWTSSCTCPHSDISEVFLRQMPANPYTRSHNPHYISWYFDLLLFHAHLLWNVPFLPSMSLTRDPIQLMPWIVNNYWFKPLPV